MLYAITDKFNRPFGVHECAPKDILAHVRSLPPQGAPYLTQPAMPLLRRVHARMMAGSMYAGLLYGSLGASVAFEAWIWLK